MIESESAVRLHRHRELLERLLAEKPESTAEALGLGTARGPNALNAEPPSKAAEAIARGLAHGAMDELRRVIPIAKPALEFSNRPPILLETPRVAAERDLVQLGCELGFPLVTECAPGLGDATMKRLAASRTPTFEPRAEFLASQLSSVIPEEHRLWILAGYPRIPYSVAFHAIEWFAAPVELADGTRRPPRFTLCLRCGALLIPRRVTKRMPLCGPCSQEPTTARRWPEHAVMPHTRGQWWLRCRDAHCTKVFIGRRQARFCPGHRSASTAPRARRRSVIQPPSSS